MPTPDLVPTPLYPVPDDSEPMRTSSENLRNAYKRYNNSPAGKARNIRMRDSQKREDYLKSEHFKEIRRQHGRKHRAKHLNTSEELRIA